LTISGWKSDPPKRHTIRTGGSWDRSAGVHFIACQAGVAKRMIKEHPQATDSILVALNHTGTSVKNGRLQNSTGFAELVRMAEDHGIRLFIDSGAYSFVVAEAARRNSDVQSMFMSDDLTRTPEFDEQKQHFMAFLDAFGEKVWGYCELDIGSVERRTEVRQDFIDAGHTPIPAFRALFDPLSYAEELLSTYDRLCFAGLVNAPRVHRTRIMWWFSMLAKKHPQCYVHSLGMKPTRELTSLGFHSCDSTTFLNLCQFSVINKLSLGRSETYREIAYIRDAHTSLKELTSSPTFDLQVIGAFQYNGYARGLAKAVSTMKALGGKK
jgi:hypothetical protein